jgi:hypothetical protein
MFEHEALDHGSMKHTDATVSVTAPEINGGIHFCISLHQALGGSTGGRHLFDIICQKSGWPALPTDQNLVLPTNFEEVKKVH